MRLQASRNSLLLWPELAQISFPTARVDMATLDRYRFPIFLGYVEPAAAAFRANRVGNIKNHQETSLIRSRAAFSTAAIIL
jgi:hypothetical protein